MQPISLLAKNDYVILDTNYTSRIVEKFGDDTEDLIYSFLFDEINYDEHLVCIKDELWGKYNGHSYTLYGKQEEVDFVESVKKANGYILLKDVDLNQVYKLVDGLGEPENSYCAFCGKEYITDIDLYFKDNKRILYVSVDTESG